ncbi:MAG TPA: DUF1702 family protein, partial [Solirubrobacteraceae bacterium]|nr:DUF1702 family protein [Solirubrobacteraceae bacterium]
MPSRYAYSPMTDDGRVPHPLRVRLLGIEPGEASFARRGFASCDAVAQARLELVGRTFVAGYRAALADDDPPALAARLDDVDAELRGFAYEGAAMALALLDQVLPVRRRLAAFLAGPGEPHVYMVHVGAGWALARLRRGPRALAALDPLLRSLALDGYGFHSGYFAPRRHLGEQRVPRRLTGYAARAFDQGLGRCSWFATGGEAARAAGVIARFPAVRRPDLWSGLALAVTYAGPASEEALRVLRTAGAPHAPHLAQGAAFAAAARERAGNP